MNNNAEKQYELKKELAQMLKGGVIMDVTTPEQAKIAEEAGACAVMALERIPADIRAAGGVSRMSDPKMIRGIQEAVSIPVMAKCRIGHFAEAQILEAIEIDYIDESEVLSPADDVYHIDKKQFKVPFVCGAKDLGEALRRINEGASMIRTKGEPVPLAAPPSTSISILRLPAACRLRCRPLQRNNSHRRRPAPCPTAGWQPPRRCLRPDAGPP